MYNSEQLGNISKTFRGFAIYQGSHGTILHHYFP